MTGDERRVFLGSLLSLKEKKKTEKLIKKATVRNSISYTVFFINRRLDLLTVKKKKMIVSLCAFFVFTYFRFEFGQKDKEQAGCKKGDKGLENLHFKLITSD